ncbi:MAG: sulfotransferase [Candidatus Magnetoglobus multicellularis str. Araruama]|uniref:Sulfotransferase n=1 Tax=Candidatus Magnetoglobus multicellularis str. Araruama TaxID=890399 RepID=A0A1V1NZS8_9BACT|nr:MAG: sulfotransferase [Candidatus Magnetoglobus multicellularis str. Araruama]
MISKTDFLDFLYIGAPRCGSTWLAAALNEHPNVWIPHNKEVHFFNDRSLYPFEYQYPKGIMHYKKYFSQAPDDAMLGELSPLYYFDPNAAYRIFNHFPNVKIISFLRNPVDVVFSSYLKRSQLERRENTFEGELNKNPQFMDLGFYHRLLTPYFDRFPQNQIHIQIFEEFFLQQEKGIAEIYNYIGVDNAFVPSVINKKINVSSPPASNLHRGINGFMLKLLNQPNFIIFKRILHQLKMNRHSYKVSTDSLYKKPILQETTKAQLKAQFLPDIHRLETLLNKDLSIWLK